MEQLIFLVIMMVIAGIGNLMSKKQEAEKQRQRGEAEPTLRRDQLPEEIRRQLYGDTDDIPTARPRQTPPPRRQPPAPAVRPQPPAPRPEAVAPQRRVPPSPPWQSPVAAEATSIESDVSLEDVRPSWEDAPAPPQRRAPPPRRQSQPRRQAVPAPPVDTSRMDAADAEAAGRVAVAQAVAAIAAAPPMTRSAPQPRGGGYGLQDIFGTRDALRRAILAQEILGPPVSLRR